jgi:cytochrome P450
MFEAEIQKYIKKRLLEVNDGIIDLEDFFSSISLDIISILLFGKTSRDQVQLVNQTIASAFKLIARMYIPGYRLLMKTPLPLSKEFDQNMQQLNLLLKQLINNRDHSNNKYSGTIDLLVETGLKQEEILSQVLALFLAGHETTSTTLTWLVYGVLKNEYLSTQFLQECSTAVQKNTSYELMDQFPQLKAIIYETFRFYPPIWSIGRKVIKPIMIDQIQLVPGDFVGLSTYVMHRHPNSFELADQYIPARWITENGFYRPKPHEFFPFSHGSRNCIGKILAETEIFNMIKFLFNQFDLKLITKEKVEAKAFIALKPDQKILVEFKRR